MQRCLHPPLLRSLNVDRVGARAEDVRPANPPPPHGSVSRPQTSNCPFLSSETTLKAKKSQSSRPIRSSSRVIAIRKSYASSCRAIRDPPSARRPLKPRPCTRRTRTTKESRSSWSTSARPTRSASQRIPQTPRARKISRRPRPPKSGSSQPIRA